MKHYLDEFYIEALKTELSHDFLLFAFNVKKSISQFSYSILAKKSGYKSKSYPRAVLMGEKPVVSKNLEVWSNGLSLKSHWKKYFYLLFEREQFLKKTNDYKEVTKKINLLRQKITKIIERPKDDTKIKLIKHWAKIQSALPSKGEGIEIENISKLTGVSLKELSLILEKMYELKLVEKRGKNWVTRDEHVDLAGKLDQDFWKNSFLSTVDRLKHESITNYSSKEKLFLSSNFLVSQKKLPELKNRLRELMIEFIENEQEDYGDHIVELCLGFM